MNNFTDKEKELMSKSPGSQLARQSKVQGFNPDFQSRIKTDPTVDPSKNVKENVANTTQSAYPTALGAPNSSEQIASEVLTGLNRIISSTSDAAHHAMASEALKAFSTAKDESEVLAQAIALTSDPRYVIALAHARAAEILASRQEDIKAFFDRPRQEFQLNIFVPKLPEPPSLNYLP